MQMLGVSLVTQLSNQIRILDFAVNSNLYWSLLRIGLEITEISLFIYFGFRSVQFCGLLLLCILFQRSLFDNLQIFKSGHLLISSKG